MPADPGYASRVRRSFAAQTMMDSLSIRIVDLGPGHIELVMPHDPRFAQQHGYTHAGAIGAAMDSACGYAAFSLMPADAAVLTVEYKLNLLRPAASPRFRISARVVKAGRTLTVCHAEALPEDGDEPIAVMTGTLMTLIDASIRG